MTNGCTPLLTIAVWSEHTPAFSTTPTVGERSVAPARPLVPAPPPQWPQPQAAIRFHHRLVQLLLLLLLGDTAIIVAMPYKYVRCQRRLVCYFFFFAYVGFERLQSVIQTTSIYDGVMMTCDDVFERLPTSVTRLPISHIRWCHDDV